MRKIKSITDIEKARRRNNIILGVGMIVLLTVSSLGYSLMNADGSKKNSVSENGFNFVRENGRWKLSIENPNDRNKPEVFKFQHLPSEVNNVSISISAQLGTYSNQPIYFVNPGVGASEILGNIGNYILRYQEACLDSGIDNMDNATCKGDLPIKDCTSNLIIFEQGNDTRVYQKGSCVFIVGDNSLGSDAFLYEVLGI